MDINFNIVDNYVRSLHTLNETMFILSKISDNCKINTTFNGGANVCSDKREFIEYLLQGHFNNTTKIIVKSSNITSENNMKFLTVDHIIVERKGYGRDEDGPGVYSIKSTGIITIDKGEIVNISYIFDKNKI
jgi:hypothetical protein